MITDRSRSDLKWAWTLALACFVIAAGTGALLRFAMLRGAPWGLHLQDIRHAHSHFMYFGWATPALMALILSNVERATGQSLTAGSRRSLAATFLVALLAYLSFLFFGYRPAPIGGHLVPLSTVASGLNVVAWYAFVHFYRRATSGLPRVLPLRLWDAALVFLVLSSLGAWGLAASVLLNIDSALLASALTHLFLDLFADGWFLLALLGLAFVVMPAPDEQASTRLGENLLIIGLPLTFFLSVPVSLLPAAVRLIAGLGAFLAGAGLLILLMALLKSRSALPDRAQRWLWSVCFFFLGLKALAFLVTGFPEGSAWSLRMGLRVSYLHWLLLGGISVGLIAAARHRWASPVAPAWHLFLLTVVILILSLVPLSGLFPANWKGLWIFEVATWAATGPVLVALWMLLNGFRAASPRHGHPPEGQHPTATAISEGTDSAR